MSYCGTFTSRNCLIKYLSALCFLFLVVYGQKRKEMGPIYEGHAGQLAPTLAELAKLEKEAQLLFLQRFCSRKN